MPFAIIQTGGKQYRVETGTVITVEKLAGEIDAEIVFPHVLATEIDGALSVGAPFLEGVTVTAKVMDQKKGEKIRVATYKSKKRQRRTIGHRQQLTQVKVTSIGAAPAAKPAAKRATKATTEDAA